MSREYKSNAAPLMLVEPKSGGFTIYKVESIKERTLYY
jgi:hypothetical protein